MKKNLLFLIPMVIVAVFVVLAVVSASIYFDYNAYKEIGENFLEVFFTNFTFKN